MRIILSLLFTLASSSVFALGISDQAKCLKKSMNLGFRAEDAYQICSLNKSESKICIFEKQKNNIKNYSGNKLSQIGSQTISECQK